MPPTGARTGPHARVLLSSFPRTRRCRSWCEKVTASQTCIRIFSNESALCIRWPKYWSFSFSIIPSKEHPGLISFRMDWLDLLAVQGTPKSLLQHHSSKASILRRSGFFIVQLSHPCMTTGKTIALTRQTFVGKATSLPLLAVLVA
uniref:Amnion associated transmembrane protein n=1 Tax=Ovis aries TaxID=9940 RepID=A0AC11D2J0_SHEEP